MKNETAPHPHYQLPIGSFEIKCGIAIRNRMNPHGNLTSIYKHSRVEVGRTATHGSHRLNFGAHKKPLEQEFAEWMDDSIKAGAAIVAGGATGEGGLYHSFLRDMGLLKVRVKANGPVYPRNVSETDITVASQSTATAAIQFDKTQTVSGTVEYPTMPQPAPTTAYQHNAT